MRIVFMGTPDFSAQILEALISKSVNASVKPNTDANTTDTTNTSTADVGNIVHTLNMADTPSMPDAVNTVNTVDAVNTVYMSNMPYTPGMVDTVNIGVETAMNLEIVAVFAQPDRPAGRGKKLQSPASKILAQAHKIPVYQPESMRTVESQELLRSLEPDILVVAAYGMILSQEILDIPKFGAYNVHTSLLPKYRGAAPVQRCLMAGDKFSGVTIIRMDAGMDTGSMLLQQAMSIQEDDNTASLLHSLGESGAKLILGALRMISEDRAAFIEQNNNVATYAPKLTKEEAVIDWAKSAKEIHNHVRGFSPNPGATTNIYMEGKDTIAVRVEKGRDLTDIFASNSIILASGDISFKDSGATSSGATSSAVQASRLGGVLGVYENMLCIACGKGIYGIQSLRLAGKSSMDIQTFKNGYKQYFETMYFESI